MNAPIRTAHIDAGVQPGAPDGPQFVHLKVHSAYSLLEGALPISRIADLAVDNKFPAVALTDTNNLFGALEFSNRLSGAGVQPIVGVSIAIDCADRQGAQATGGRRAVGDDTANRDGLIALLAATETGYANLMKLVSAAHLSVGETDSPHVRLDVLCAHSDGIIALTGGPDGPIDRVLRDGEGERARMRLQALVELFGDRLYVEIQRHGLAREKTVEPELLGLAYELHLPIVATNEAYFASPDDHEAHDALICVAEGRYVVEDDRRRLSQEHYFKSAEDMAAAFADLPEALANTVEIARRCSYRPLGRAPILPRFVKAKAGASDEDQLKAEADELVRQAREGLNARLGASGPAEGYTIEDYEKRLEYELGIIERMKFPGYFLIVADFIKWTKGQGIPVGPGRGSGAGSLVAYSLTITDLDPLRFGLLFERFLNPERVSMPDFDIDFCQDRRDEVIRYVQEKYGHDRVAQIITHGKLQARAVLRDVGRVLQMPYGQVDRLCKLVPNNPANPVTLAEAMDDEPKLLEEADAEPIVARLLEMAQKLEGLYRHASTHAAGLVIGDRPLDQLVPLYRDPKSNMPVTQFNWKMVEAAGLVKFDFLGLKTLTVLQKAVEMVKSVRGVDVDLASLTLDDKRAFELLESADTVGVFQLESTGMRESLKRLKPDRFEDIIAMVSLYRPGPMDNIPTYINRKHGTEEVDYLHPMLEGILKETYGVIIYQEQVIQIAQVMGGYSLGEADVLRRAMGKKDKAAMARQQAEFVKRAIEKGVKQKDAARIFEQVDKFAGYGFNKSHAAAYALVSYHTAYMKANFREEFLAASMTLDMSNTDKLSMFVAEARKSGIDMMPPDVNLSGVDFIAEAAGDASNSGAIRYSLAALKNIGASAVESIVSRRGAGGPYKSLGDFASRLNSKALNKRGIETMAQAGAFDAFEGDRASVHASADLIMAMAQRTEANASDGIGDLFGLADDVAQLTCKTVKPWTPLERLAQEFDAVGFYLSGHPLDSYGPILEKLGVRRYAEFEKASEEGTVSGRLAGIVVSARERRSARGNKFAFAMFSDASGQFEAVVFSDTLANSRELLTAGTPVIVSVEGEREGDTLKLRAQAIEALEAAAGSVRDGLLVVVEGRAVKSGRADVVMIRDTLKLANGVPGSGGHVQIKIKTEDPANSAILSLPGKYEVGPAIADELATLRGVVQVTEL